MVERYHIYERINRELSPIEINDGMSVTLQRGDRFFKGILAGVAEGDASDFMVLPRIGYDKQPLGQPERISWDELGGPDPNTKIFKRAS